MVMIKREPLPCYMSMSETHSSPKPRNREESLTPRPLLMERELSVIAGFIVGTFNYQLSIIMLCIKIPCWLGIVQACLTLLSLRCGIVNCQLCRARGHAYGAGKCGEYCDENFEQLAPVE